MSELAETFDDENFNDHNERKRPVFLTVLCILSWVAGGFSVLMALIMLGAKDFFIEAMETSMDFVQTEQEVLVLEATIQNYTLTSVMNFALYSISIIGVIMMFRLNKVGFYIYAFIQTVMLIFPYFIIPFSTEPMALFGVGLSVLFYVAFLIMYGVNLKHMK